MQVSLLVCLFQKKVGVEKGQGRVQERLREGGSRSKQRYAKHAQVSSFQL